MVVNVSMEGVMELPSLIKALADGTIGPILDLSYMKFPLHADFDLLCDAIGACRTLYCLEMANVALPVDYAASLARALGVTRSLQILDLSGAAINDDAIVELAPVLAKLMGLVRLSLQHNDIGDAGAAVLATMITSNTSLQMLQLTGNPFISSSSAKSMLDKVVSDRHPNLSCDVCLEDSRAPDAPPPIAAALDAAEKKFLAIPLRTRYAKCPPDQMAFFDYVKSGNVVRLSKYMKAGKDVDPLANHPEGFNAAHIAAAHGHSKMLKELIRMGVPFVTRIPASLGGYPKWYSSGTGGGSMVRFAMPRRSTPMFFAAASGDAATLKVLTMEGDKAAEPNVAGMWAHDYALPANEGDMPVIDRVVAAKVEAERIAKLSKGGGKGKGKKGKAKA